MSDIFISYRRDPSIDRAIRLKELLEKKGYDVYLDTQMGAGQFNEILIDEIRKCTYFLLLITADTFERCWDEKDIFRMEIECARYNRKTIIPLIKPGYQFPEELPVSINFLRYCNGVEIAPHLLDSCVDDLANRMICSQGSLQKDPEQVDGMEIGITSSLKSQHTDSISTSYFCCPHCKSRSVHSILLCEGDKWDYWFSEQKHRLKIPRQRVLRCIFILSIFISISLTLFILLPGSVIGPYGVIVGVSKLFSNADTVWIGSIWAIILIASTIFSAYLFTIFVKRTSDLYDTAPTIRSAIKYGDYQFWTIKCGECKQDFNVLYPKSEDIRERILTMKFSN